MLGLSGWLRTDNPVAGASALVPRFRSILLLHRNCQKFNFFAVWTTAESVQNYLCQVRRRVSESYRQDPVNSAAQVIAQGSRDLVPSEEGRCLLTARNEIKHPVRFASEYGAP